MRQRAGPVRPEQDPEQRGPAAQVPAALPGHQRLRGAGRHAGRDRRQDRVAVDRQRRVDVPANSAVAVLRLGLRLRGRPDGRRTVAGHHQTVFLPKGERHSCSKITCKYVMCHVVNIYLKIQCDYITLTQHNYFMAFLKFKN